jgi:tetratricopeptide (TPR) repeat protein
VTPASCRFWIGTYHQVLRGDHDAAVPSLEKARDLATRAGDALTLSYVLRHLGIADHAAGLLDAARGLLEESSRLRRGAGFLPGVAANLVGLAYIAAAQDRHSDARNLLDEATQLAEESGAPGILRSIDEARTQLGEDIARP